MLEDEGYENSIEHASTSSSSLPLSHFKNVRNLTPLKTTEDVNKVATQITRKAVKEGARQASRQLAEEGVTKDNPKGRLYSYLKIQRNRRGSAKAKRFNKIEGVQRDFNQTFRF